MRRALLLIAVLSPGGVAVAEARTGPCRPGGPQCHVWTGKATFVADGDTLDVDVAGDGTSRSVRVRVTGVQAMEQTLYSHTPSRRRGQCHALTATARLEALVRRGRRRVRLTAQDAGSRSRHRVRRSVAVRTARGWRDAGSVLLREGHALWLPNKVEWAWNGRYRALTQQAAAAGRRLFDSDACGAGPGGAVSVSVNWDAEGNDGRNVNGEWIRVTNLDRTRSLSLAGWWVRDSQSHVRRYTFPSWAAVPAGGSVRVHVGPGASSGSEHFWGLAEPAFENATFDERSMGDGAYLFDPHGDLRAWHVYP